MWRFSEQPAGASVWPYLIGHLESFGESHYHTLSEYFCPHIITKGRGTITTPDYSIELGAGDMFTLWPGVEIEYFDSAENPWDFYYFHIEGPGMQDFVESCGFRKEMIYFKPRQPDNVKEVFSSMYKLLQSQNVNDEFRVLSLLYQLPSFCLADEINKSRDKHSDILFKAETLINTQIATGINVNDLCSKLEISRITLFRIFQKELNQPPIAYITRKRIEKAKELLRTSQATMKTVAKLSGFQSEKYFLRRFKEAAGTTPGEYRKRGVAPQA